MTTPAITPANTPAPTTLGKIFPRLDKICDAPFIRKVLGTTKKDSILFISNNVICNAFFQIKEQDIQTHNDLIKGEILDFFQSPQMQMEVAKFKATIKEKKAQETLKKKELEKQAIIEEYLREQERKKKEAEERERLGLNPNPTENIQELLNGLNNITQNPNPEPQQKRTFMKKPNIEKKAVEPIEDKETEDHSEDFDSKSENHDDETQEEESQEETSEEDTNNISNSSTNNSSANTQRENDNETNRSQNQKREIREETEKTPDVMTLEDFTDILKAVVDQGHLVIRSGRETQTIKNIDIDPDINKLVIQLQPKATILVKK